MAIVTLLHHDKLTVREINDTSIKIENVETCVHLHEFISSQKFRFVDKLMDIFMNSKLCQY